VIDDALLDGVLVISKEAFLEPEKFLSLGVLHDGETGGTHVPLQVAKGG